MSDTTPLQLLLVEDSEADAELILRELRRSGFAPTGPRVMSEADFVAQLDLEWDLIISDFGLPQFDALRALAHVKARGLDVPFIMVSGTVGEDIAVKAMRNGASDYFLKDRLARLGESVRQVIVQKRMRSGQRELRQALEMSEARLRLALSAAKLGIWDYDIHTGDVTCSAIMAELCGYPEETSRFKTSAADSPVHPDDRQLLDAADHRALRGDGLYEVEFRVVLPNGEIRWLAEKGDVVERDSDGDGVRIMGVTWDITERKQAEKELQASESRLNEAQRIASIGSWEWAVDNDNLKWSDELYRIIGLDDSQLSPSFEDFLELVHPADRTRVEDLVASAVETREPLEYDCRITRPDGSPHVLHMRGNFVGGDQTVNMHGTVQDVTDRKSVEDALKRERDLLHLLMDNLPDQVFIKDASSRFVRINRAGADVLGLKDPSDAIGRDDADFAPAELAAIYIADDRRIMDSRVPMLDRTETIMAGDGSTRWIATTKAPTFDRDGSVTGIVGISRDITERKRLEEQLSHQAFHDGLTGLPNRNLFRDRLEHALTRTSRTGEKVSVLFVDLDGFKVINDSLGHEQGDALLLAVADRLQASVRAGDTVARLGGDEFTILLENADVGEASESADRIARRLAAPLELSGHAIFVTASIGIACKSSPLDSAGGMLRDADLAMYAAKQQGKAQFAVFDAGMQSRAWERLELEENLRTAISIGEFRVYYQPVVDLASATPVDLEALVRWQHPVRGLVSPGEFIPLAEETGLILPIGWWVMREACRQAKSWQCLSHVGPRLSVSVNLSPRMFQSAGLIAEVERILTETELDPACLRLEITEGVMIRDGEAAIETLRRLKSLGVRLAIDDFGTGYSSLTYLQRLPIDILKIDRSFIGRLGQDLESLEIVRLIIGLAKTLGLTVIGEGIETEGQRSTLLELGGDLGQGFLFDRPMPADEAMKRLANSVPFEQSLVTSGPS